MTMAIICEERTGNIAKRRLLVDPHGPEIQTESEPKMCHK